MATNILFATCLRVDKNGYNGRDNHPTQKHVGRTFRVLRTETWLSDPEMGCEPFDATEPVVNPVIRNSPRWYSETFYVCCDLETGELVDFVDHEVELSIGSAPATN